MSSRTSAYKSPSSFAKETDYFGINIDNISNVASSNNTYATTSAPITSTSPYSSTYRMKGFGGFGLAPDDLVTWVRVECEGYYTRVSGAPISAFGTSLARTDSDVFGTEFAAVLPLTSGSEAYVEVGNSGSSTDKLFNYTGMTGDTVNGSQFGLIAYAARVSGTPGTNHFWDHVRVRIEYNLRVAPQTMAVAATFGAVTLKASRVLSVSTMAATATFGTVGLTASRRLSVDTASYAATFADVALTARRALSVSTAAYTAALGDVSFVYGKILSVAGAAYSLTMGAVSFLRNRVLGVSQASYTATFNAVTLTPSAVTVTPRTIFTVAGESRGFGVAARQSLTPDAETRRNTAVDTRTLTSGADTRTHSAQDD